MKKTYTVFFNDFNSYINFDKPSKALDFMKSKGNNECYLQVFKDYEK